MSATMLSALAAASLCLGMHAGLSPEVSAWEPSQPAVVQPEGPQPAAAYDPAEDVKTIDGVMKALYASTAGPPGQARDWDRLRNLCHQDMRFLAVRSDGADGAMVFTLTVEDYIMHNKSYFEKGGFFESELARRTESFGNITHVWSTFESRLGSAGADPYTRGIYSVQLLKDGGRWWVLSCSWDMERPDNPLPEKYLETPVEGE
jgi:hypothetical protein